MLQIFGVKKGREYVSFWLRKSEADKAAEKEGCEVVPIEIDNYIRNEEDQDNI